MLYKLFKIIIILIITVLLLILGIFYYLKNDYDKRFNIEDFEEIITNTEKLDDLPQNFTNVYNEINVITSYKNMIFDKILGKYERQCPCLNLSRLLHSPSKRLFSINKFFYTLKLESKLTQQQCLKYYANRFDFLYSNVGIDKASEYYFKKSIQELGRKELIILTLMLENPILYNPKKLRGDALKRSIDKHY